MKLKFIILFAFIVGYGGGLFVDIAAHGNESKILHVMETGEIDERWIPFQSTTGLSYGLELLKINSFERPYTPSPFIQYAELSESAQQIIGSVFVEFTIGSETKETESGNEFFTTIISECKFSSSDDIPFDTCVICTLTNSTDTPLARGQVDLPDGYNAGDVVPIGINDILEEEGNDPKKLERVMIDICDNREAPQNLSESPVDSLLDELLDSDLKQDESMEEGN